MVRRKQREIPVENRTMRRERRSRTRRPLRLKDWQIGVSLAVLIAVVLIVRAPLANYIEQRAEIQRLEAEITAQKQEKIELQDKIARYNDEAYIREQARARLGVIDPGEMAFRVIDPSLDDAPTDAGHEEEDRTVAEQKWYQLLWDSVTSEDPEEPESEVAPAPTMELPLAPLG
ncbi:MAG: septum formation initiator family protein [Corynebacterium sp.]|nr:septum formation initiator family protein [Corynebacterium sp.]